MSTTDETIDEATRLTLADRRAFLTLPLKDRRRILEQQAEAVVATYDLEPNRLDREEWQDGDVVEY